MAGVACIRDFECVGLHRCHKMKRMTAHVDVRDGLLDLRHVTSDALTARAISFVVSVCLDRHRVRAVLRVWSVAGAAYIVDRFAEHRLVRGTVRIVA